MGFNSLVRDDPVYIKRMKRMLALKDKSETWIEELVSLQVSRGVGALTTSGLLSNSQMESLDSNINNQMIRSRSAVIKIQALRQIVVIDESLKYLRKYLSYKYDDELKRYKTVAAKRNAVELTLEKAVNMSDRLSGVIKIADVVLEDSDSAGFTLKRIGDVLALKARDSG